MSLLTWLPLVASALSVVFAILGVYFFRPRIFRVCKFFDTSSTASTILDVYRERATIYGYVTVSEIKALVDDPVSTMDCCIGWTSKSLRKGFVVSGDEGYIIQLPAPKVLRHKR